MSKLSEFKRTVVVTLEPNTSIHTAAKKQEKALRSTNPGYTITAVFVSDVALEGLFIALLPSPLSHTPQNLVRLEVDTTLQRDQVKLVYLDTQGYAQSVHKPNPAD